MLLIVHCQYHTVLTAHFENQLLITSTGILQSALKKVIGRNCFDVIVLTIFAFRFNFPIRCVFVSLSLF